MELEYMIQLKYAGLFAMCPTH